MDQTCSSCYLAAVAWNNLPASAVVSDKGNVLKKHWADHTLMYNFLATPPICHTHSLCDHDDEIGPYSSIYIYRNKNNIILKSNTQST